ncbi:MAG TPA: hypothetical protein PK156_23425 [Polyangium sp.]|nr:hypothetical protein [Polyangium sp.]
MKMATIFSSFVVLGLVAAPASEAMATNYSLWINGRSNSAPVGSYDDFRYWGPSSASAGVNKKAVNWNGYDSIASTNGAIRNALDCFCTGSNWCYIAAHDAGDAQIGYVLSMYGASSRYKKNATANSSGVCGNTDGGTQTGWNIKWVRVAGGAAGGSELSDYGSWPSTEPLVKDLKTTTVRALYNHNNTASAWFYMYAGAAGIYNANILPGQHDEVVAYHSSGAKAGSAGSALGNPNDFLINDLTLGTSANEGGSVKWSYHSVALRDDSELYNHFPAGNWAGIVAPMRSDMVLYAR